MKPSDSWRVEPAFSRSAGREPARTPRANGDQGMTAISSVSQSGIISRSSSR